MQAQVEELQKKLDASYQYINDIQEDLRISKQSRVPCVQSRFQQSEDIDELEFDRLNTHRMEPHVARGEESYSSQSVQVATAVQDAEVSCVMDKDDREQLKANFREDRILWEHKLHHVEAQIKGLEERELQLKERLNVAVNAAELEEQKGREFQAQARAALVEASRWKNHMEDLRRSGTTMLLNAREDIFQVNQSSDALKEIVEDIRSKGSRDVAVNTISNEHVFGAHAESQGKKFGEAKANILFEIEASGPSSTPEPKRTYGEPPVVITGNAETQLKEELQVTGEENGENDGKGEVVMTSRQRIREIDEIHSFSDADKYCNALCGACRKVFSSFAARQSVKKTPTEASLDAKKQELTDAARPSSKESDGFFGEASGEASEDTLKASGTELYTSSVVDCSCHPASKNKHNQSMQTEEVEHPHSDDTEKCERKKLQSLLIGIIRIINIVIVATKSEWLPRTADEEVLQLLEHPELWEDSNSKRWRIPEIVLDAEQGVTALARIAVDGMETSSKLNRLLHDLDSVIEENESLRCQISCERHTSGIPSGSDAQVQTGISINEQRCSFPFSIRVTHSTGIQTEASESERDGAGDNGKATSFFLRDITTRYEEVIAMLRERLNLAEERVEELTTLRLDNAKLEFTMWNSQPHTLAEAAEVIDSVSTLILLKR